MDALTGVVARSLVPFELADGYIPASNIVKSVTRCKEDLVAYTSSPTIDVVLDVVL